MLNIGQDTMASWVESVAEYCTDTTMAGGCSEFGLTLKRTPDRVI